MKGRRLHSSKLGRGQERGAALIEMTLVVPFLLTLGLGVFEFGNIYYKYHLLENAVRDAARFASSRGGVCSGGQITSSLKSEIEAIALRTGSGNEIWTPGYQITPSCKSYPNNNFTYRGTSTIYSVTVTATVPYKPLGFLGFFNLASPVLKVSQEERVLVGS